MLSAASAIHGTQLHLHVDQRVTRVRIPEDPLAVARIVVPPVRVGVLATSVVEVVAGHAGDVGAVLVPPRADEGKAAARSTVVIVHVVGAERSSHVLRCQGVAC